MNNLNNFMPGKKQTWPAFNEEKENQAGNEAVENKGDRKIKINLPPEPVIFMRSHIFCKSLKAVNQLTDTMLSCCDFDTLQTIYLL